MFFSCQPNHRKQGDNLSPRGHIYSTKPIISKAQGMSISAVASNQNLGPQGDCAHQNEDLAEKWLLDNLPWAKPLYLWHPLGAAESPEVPRLKLKPPRVMHNMDANSSAWPLFTLMDVQHLQGTKISTWAGLQDGRWKGCFFQIPGNGLRLRPKMWAIRTRADWKTGSCVQVHAQQNTSTWDQKPSCTHRLHAEGSPQHLWGWQLSWNSESTQIQLPALPPV